GRGLRELCTRMGVVGSGMLTRPADPHMHGVRLDSPGRVGRPVAVIHGLRASRPAWLPWPGLRARWTGCRIFCHQTPPASDMPTTAYVPARANRRTVTSHISSARARSFARWRPRSARWFPPGDRDPASQRAAAWRLRAHTILPDTLRLLRLQHLYPL